MLALTPFFVLIIVFATWRMSVMVVEEEGPFGLFSWLRTWPYPFGSNQRHTGVFDCVACLSVWLGAGALCLWISGIVGTAIVLGLAISGGALLIDNLFRREQGNYE